MAFTFYNSLPNKIEVLSFDLDDTLYQNEDVIVKAEQAQFDAICRLVPDAKKAGMAMWKELKWQVAEQMPEVRHDVTEWRVQVIKQGLAKFGVTEANVITQVYDAFYTARSNFEVPEQTFAVLAQLRTKFKLIAVTNGNVDIHRIGLAKYFDAYYRAGEQHCRMKPYPDMLLKAIQDLSLSGPDKVLHIGDNVKADVKAAQNAGIASLWFNPSGNKYPRGFALPNSEYTKITDLLELLG